MVKKIKHIHARQIYDSRGFPTVECDVILESGTFGRSAVPSGASTGSREAIELRDNDPGVNLGKGVTKAVENVNTVIADALRDKDAEDQAGIDEVLIQLDGTENKSKLGANAILSVSLACAKAVANDHNLFLFNYLANLGKSTEYVLPLPLMNIVNGGKHADWSTDIQEYMILPVGARNFAHAMQMASEIFHTLGKVIKQKSYTTLVGDEGGFAPQVTGGNEEPFQLMSQAIDQAGYKLGEDVVFGVDCAASEFFENGKYVLKKEGKEFSSDEMIDWLVSLTQKYPIVSIEDGLDESDWEGWKKLTAKLGNKIQLVGDDLFVTNSKYLKRGIEEQSANAILIKVNQIGTLTETLQAMDLAKKQGWKNVISHRSGETEDTTISHLAVGLGAGQIKTGSLSRSDRIAKYNELLRIEESLGEKAVYAGRNALR